MTTERRKPMVLACEFLKAARGRWATKADFESELQVSDMTVAAWVDEYIAQGMLIERRRTPATRRTGVPPMEYTLAAQWGGVE